MKKTVKTGYMKVIQDLWDVKDSIAKETKDMNMEEHIKYVEHNTCELKKRFNSKFVNRVKKKVA